MSVQDEILDLLSVTPDSTINRMAKELGRCVESVRAACYRLRDLGKVKSTGRRLSMVWRLAGDTKGRSFFEHKNFPAWLEHRP